MTILRVPALFAVFAFLICLSATSVWAQSLVSEKVLQDEKQSVNVFEPIRLSERPQATFSNTLALTDPTFNRTLGFNQGGACTLSGVGTAVHYKTIALTVPAAANVTISLVPADGATITPATADTFMILYPAGGFNPAAACTNAITANDDASGTAQSRITTTVPLAAGNYTLIVTSFANTPAAPGALPWTYTGQLTNITVAPSAASVSVAGKVRTPNGKGLTNAYITLTDSSGNYRLARTTAFGYFRFEDVAPGETYIIQVLSKRYRFMPQVLSITQDLADLELTGENIFSRKRVK